MQNLQDIQDKIFFETISILESLAKIESADELIMKQGLFAEVSKQQQSRNNTHFNSTTRFLP